MSDLKTPVFDWAAGEFVTDNQGAVVTATGSAAMVQIAVKAQQTARGKYLIYANPEDLELHHKYGNDAWTVLADQTISEAVRLSELKRVIREAILYDPWVKNVSDVDIYQETVKDGIVLWYASFTFSSIWDESKQIEGVLLNG